MDQGIMMCEKCGAEYELRDGCDVTAFCDLCAQDIVERMRFMVPQLPKSITWVQGVQILGMLQAELFPEKPYKNVPK